MQIENAVVLFAGFMSLIVPFYMMAVNSRSSSNRWYALTSLVIGPLWTITIVAFREADTLQDALFWDKAIYLTAVVIGLLFHNFTKVFPRVRQTNPIPTILYWITGLAFVYQILFTNNFVVSVTLTENGNSVVLGAWYIYWAIWMMSIFFIGLWDIIRHYSQLGEIEKNQLRYYTIGVSIAAVGIFPTNTILPMFGVYNLIWVGPLCILLMNIVIGYGITRTRFVSSSNLLAFTIKLLFVTLMLLAVAFGIETLLKTIGSVDGFSESVYLLFIILLLTSIVLIILIHWLDTSFLRRVIKGKYNLVEVRDIFAKELSAQMDLNKLAQLIVGRLGTILQIEQVGFVIFNADYSRVVFGQYRNMQQIPIEDLIELYTSAERDFNQDEPAIASELEYKLVNQIGEPNARESERMSHITKLMARFGIGMIFNLQPRIEYKGMLFIGKKEGGDVFNVEDIDLLKSLINNIAIALSRGFLFTEVQRFNEGLQMKIDKATSKITKQKEEIQSALTKERDMLDILGHELRTPLGIARNAVSFIISQQKAGKLDKKHLDEYLSIADENLKREISTVETILSGTKIDNNRLNLSLTKVDLLDVVEDSLLANKPKAQNKNLKLTYKAPAKAEVYADRTRIQEVVDNIIDNAIKYTEQGSVTITITQKGYKTQISFADTGVGIPKEDIAKLGNKFYRVNNYLKNKPKTGLQVVRPGGTGLGLYVVFNLIKAMDGEYQVESEIGQGTEFILSFPTFTGQKDSFEEAETIQGKIAKIKKKLQEDIDG